MNNCSNSSLQDDRALGGLASDEAPEKVAITLLTGGGDRPYAFGLATELIRRGMALDVIGSDDLDCPELRNQPRVNFLNLRGDQRPGVNLIRKSSRVLSYYLKLISYAATAQPKIFHILWNNKFQTFDRTLLMLYYKMLGKRIVLTVHNVNAARRDSKDTIFNRLTLGVQYRLTERFFVHTAMMKCELINDFGVEPERITVIPFGINNAVPITPLSANEAKEKLGLRQSHKTILFFGNIAPYKGLEYLVLAFQRIKDKGDEYRLLIAGRPKNCDEYWNRVHALMGEDLTKGRILLRTDYIPDNETELYFKAADALVLPYTFIYQSGVLFLGHSFGLPALAADVGSLKDDIEEGKTGFVFKSEDPDDLARTIQRYFASGLYRNLEQQRQEIRAFATAQHSWDIVGFKTVQTYTDLLRSGSHPAANLEKSHSSMEHRQ